MAGNKLFYHLGGFARWFTTPSTNPITADGTSDADFAETIGRKVDTGVTVASTFSSIMGYLKGLVGAVGSRVSSQSGSAATANWVKNKPYLLMTGVGLIKIKSIIAKCDITLVGATTTMIIRESVGDNALIGIITCTDFDADDLLTGRDTATHAASFAVEEAEGVYIMDADIEVFLSNDNDITVGQFTLYVDWEPVSDGATLIAATWADNS